MAFPRDYEDMLELLGKHQVRYLIVGGVAVSFHARPRHTKDLDIWVDPSQENLQRANRALTEFGSPLLLEPQDIDGVVQIGVGLDRIDLILSPEGVRFDDAWPKRSRGDLGKTPANWVDLETLIRMKEPLTGARHVEDVRVLKKVRELRAKGS